MKQEGRGRLGDGRGLLRTVQLDFQFSVGRGLLAVLGPGRWGWLRGRNAAGCATEGPATPLSVRQQGEPLLAMQLSAPGDWLPLLLRRAGRPQGPAVGRDLARGRMP